MVNHIKSAQEWGIECFGSSDVYWMKSITKVWPTMPLWIDGKKYEGFLDIGANILVLSYQS